MSASKWAYTPEKCDGDVCVGECDICPKATEAISIKTLTNLIDSQGETIKTYHRLCMIQEAEIRALREKLEGGNHEAD